MFITLSRRVLTSLCRKQASYFLFRKTENGIQIQQRFHFTRPNLSGRIGVSHGSRYVPPARNEVAEENIQITLRSVSCMNTDEWDDFKSDLFEKIDCVSEETFGALVMNALLALNKLNLSHSFIQYLEQGSIKPNFLIYLKYLSLCSKNYEMVDQDIILKTINKVKPQLDESPVLDMKRAEYIIQGLCATDRWKESFKYLNKLTVPKPSNEICNAIACAAIRNGDENLAWDILMNWINCYETVCDRVIKEFVLVALNMQKPNPSQSEKLMLKLFSYMQSHHIIIGSDVSKLIEQYFKCHRMKWSITNTKVSRKGICGTCKHTLMPSTLENDEFKALKDAFLQKVVMKSDLFINSTSKEFENYMKFIELNKPFHVVLDGLNAVYSYRGVQNKKNFSYHLLNLVSLLSGKSRNILVLGRKHMQSWPKYQMIKISHKAKLFFMDNISQDDPFVIYAALASGPHTLFLSDDLMRDHISRLDDPKLIHLFKKWQQSHQIFIECDEINSIKLIVLSSFLLVILAEAYSDVDLRIAERKVIPHYVRHSYEYADIDIKKIMQQRGIQIKPYQPSNLNRGTTSPVNRGAAHHQVPNAVHNRNRIWMSHRGKTQAMSNHLEPQPNRYHMKKFQHYSKNMRNIHRNDKFKMKNRYH